MPTKTAITPKSTKSSMILLSSIIIANIIEAQMIPKRFFEDKEYIDLPVDDEFNISCLNTSITKNNKNSVKKVVNGIKTAATSVKKALETKKCEKKECHI